MHGAQILQLRQQLAALTGKTAPGNASDVYDGELSQLVRDFQRAHRLNADGVAGVQTLVVLNGALAKPDSPQLCGTAGTRNLIMSFILDALKKSETERQRADAPALYEVKMARRRGAALPYG